MFLFRTSTQVLHLLARRLRPLIETIHTLRVSVCIGTRQPRHDVLQTRSYQIAVPEGPFLFSWFVVFCLPLPLLWSLWIVITTSSSLTTTTKVLSVPPPFLRAGTHRHVMNPTLLGALLGRRVLAGLGGALLLLLLLILFVLLLLRSGGFGAAIVASGRFTVWRGGGIFARLVLLCPVLVRWR